MCLQKLAPASAESRASEVGFQNGWCATFQGSSCDTHCRQPYDISVPRAQLQLGSLPRTGAEAVRRRLSVSIEERASARRWTIALRCGAATTQESALAGASAAIFLPDDNKKTAEDLSSGLLGASAPHVVHMVHVERGRAIGSASITTTHRSASVAALASLPLPVGGALDDTNALLDI